MARRAKSKKAVAIDEFAPKAPKPYAGILATPVWSQEVKLPDGVRADWSDENVKTNYLHFRREQARLYLEARIALYEHYDIDISQPGANDLLLNALIAAHVPAFRLDLGWPQMQSFRSTGSGQPTRLDPTEIIVFLVDVEEAKAQLGEKASDRKIAALLASNERYQKLGLKTETIRKLIAQLKTAFDDLKASRASEFQLNFIFRTIPLIDSLRRDSGD